METDPSCNPPLSLRLKRFLPRSLFGRTLVIFVVPTFIMLAVATYVFFDRHWYTVTNRMAQALAGDIAAVVELLQRSNSSATTDGVKHLALKKMELTVNFAPGEPLKHIRRPHTPIAVILKRALNDKLSYSYVFDLAYAPNTIGILVEVPEGVYTFLTPEKRIYSPTTEVFILWLLGSSIFLTAIALVIMRNQIRPIRRLAAAAEAIGKGREVPWFKVEGASEVRQAGAALMVMRDRLKRQIGQRTSMLAGVSHDLRTPLTRMRLQAELMGNNGPDMADLLSDIAEMEAMLNAYLAFARGEEAEAATETSLSKLLDEIASAARRQNPNVSLDVPPDIEVIIRRNALKRCLTNLVANALRYGSRAEIHAQASEQFITILIDDDGPGISPELREEMFRPFTRAEESRNRATGGIGLGLTIARDIARSHGGDVVLEDSPLGGLRARVWIPV
ncbi:MAG: ATP-binding protein [Alphaproteobacteria bacterium]|nr:ATP-binding protein [Alphaproteobacteria bacterium]